MVSIIVPLLCTSAFNNHVTYVQSIVVLVPRSNILVDNKSKMGITTLDDTCGIIAEKVDLLFEKRYDFSPHSLKAEFNITLRKAIRESALKALHATLALRYCGEALESRFVTTQ